MNSAAWRGSRPACARQRVRQLRRARPRRAAAPRRRRAGCDGSAPGARGPRPASRCCGWRSRARRTPRHESASAAWMPKASSPLAAHRFAPDVEGEPMRECARRRRPGRPRSAPGGGEHGVRRRARARAGARAPAARNAPRHHRILRRLHADRRRIVARVARSVNSSGAARHCRAGSRRSFETVRDRRAARSLQRSATPASGRHAPTRRAQRTRRSRVVVGCGRRRLGARRAVWLGARSLRAAGARPGRFFAENFDLVGYHDLDGRPAFKLALQVVGDRWYLYTSHFWDRGWSVLDVTDPSRPRAAGLRPGSGEHGDAAGAGRRRSHAHRASRSRRPSSCTTRPGRASPGCCATRCCDGPKYRALATVGRGRAGLGRARSRAADAARRVGRGRHRHAPQLLRAADATPISPRTSPAFAGTST